MLCCIGDLVEDVVVWLSSDIAKGTDTEASISRQRGGSAANVAVSAASAGAHVRFIGRVGSDAIGAALIDELRESGVDTRVQQQGRTGTIVVLVDAEGERSMLPDRAAATELEGVDASDLDDVRWLHVPAYSLVVEPLATTARHAIEQVHEAGGVVSIDASSVAIIKKTGRDPFKDLIRDLRPDVLFCNADEAVALGISETMGADGAALTVVKAGSKPAFAYAEGAIIATVPARQLDTVRDTTGAGDAFAAGFITAQMASDDVPSAIAQGHRLAAALLTQHTP